jgi:hypothetical protein
MSADALKVQKQLESGYIAETARIDDAAISLFNQDEKQARKYLTDYSIKSSQNTFDKWKDLSEYLLVKYIDGNIKREKNGKFERNAWGNPVMPLQPGYSEAWKKAVIQETGSKLLMPPVSGGH